MQELTELTDAEFEELQSNVMTEQVRRNRIKEIPNEIAALKTQYESVGGTKEQLIDKLNEPIPELEAKLDAEVSTQDTAKDISEPL
jgi:predicted nuclease with TOPRIM domain